MKRQKKPRQNFYRVNWQIRASPVRLIDEQGKQIGVVPLQKAREIAQEKGLDLVEVAPRAKPPVVKIVDYASLNMKKTKNSGKQGRKLKKEQSLKKSN